MINLKKNAELVSVSEDDETGIIEGYASVFGQIDSYGDTIDPRAYDKVLAEKQSPIMLFCHDDWSIPIGKWTSLEVDSYGLKVKGQINLNSQQGKEVYEAVKFGALTGLSVGFCCTKDDIEDDDKSRIIKNVQRLYEISLVPIPADNFARISSIKSADLQSINSIKELETCLRDAGASRTRAKEFISVAKRVLSHRDDADKRDAISRKLQSILSNF